MNPRMLLLITVSATFMRVGVAQSPVVAEAPKTVRTADPQTWPVGVRSATVLPTDDELPRGFDTYLVQPMSFRQQSRYFARQTFSLGALAGCLPAAGINMALPPGHYPREWRDGGGAFGRDVGDALAGSLVANTAKYLSGALLHEDPRYYPAFRKGAARRIGHAIAFTLVDASSTGKRRPAVSNLLGALAAGYVGRLYLPKGFDDDVHARQRSLSVLIGYSQSQAVGFGTQNMLNEFAPELRRVVKRLRSVV